MFICESNLNGIQADWLNLCLQSKIEWTKCEANLKVTDSCGCASNLQFCKASKQEPLALHFNRLHFYENVLQLFYQLSIEECEWVHVVPGQNSRFLSLFAIRLLILYSVLFRFCKLYLFENLHIVIRGTYCVSPEGLKNPRFLLIAPINGLLWLYSFICLIVSILKTKEVELYILASASPTKMCSSTSRWPLQGVFLHRWSFVTLASPPTWRSESSITAASEQFT